MKLIRNFSIYTVVGFLNAGIGFLLLPVLTKYLTPADYGIISLINVYVAILTPIVGMSTSGYATVEYYNRNINKQEFGRVFSSVRIVPILGIFPILIIFLAGQSVFPGLMELPLNGYWLILPMLLFTLYHNNFTSFLLATKRAFLFSVTTAGKIVFEISLTLLFLIYLNKGWDGRIYSALVTAIGFSLLSVWYYRKWNLLSRDIRSTYIRQALLFGAPLILHQIGKFVINQADRLFLVKMVSLQEMGIYSVGYTVGSAIMILVGAFANFYSPFLYERLAKGSEKAKLEVIRVSYLFIGISFAALLALTVGSPLLFRFFINSTYGSAVQYVFWIGLGYFFWGFYIIFAGYIFYLKKTKILGYLAIFNVVLNCALNYVLIKWLGAIGAAYATCVSFFVVAVIIGLIVNKLHPMPWVSFFGNKKPNT